MPRIVLLTLLFVAGIGDVSYSETVSTGTQLAAALKSDTQFQTLTLAPNVIYDAPNPVLVVGKHVRIKGARSAVIRLELQFLGGSIEIMGVTFQQKVAPPEDEMAPPWAHQGAQVVCRGCEIWFDDIAASAMANAKKSFAEAHGGGLHIRAHLNNVNIQYANVPAPVVNCWNGSRCSVLTWGVHKATLRAGATYAVIYASAANVSIRDSAALVGSGSTAAGLLLNHGASGQVLNASTLMNLTHSINVINASTGYVAPTVILVSTGAAITSNGGEIRQ
ncbi:MAG: hypothetical protein Q7R45_08445 [Sulfuricaulis sp.]|nr:hypothetical protein [Sulfuricaulis sp.]